ncbi:hypothetical protein [Roseitranquillus sediminis]|uniref:hypothetical protein n=1 Tax=Roseitranquillus sediminis TaxID=2809051 RepID=UPI001D0C1F2F|nr:hypothetical protein [Roseitranquillus sediminis]MBM9595626.1 hypothetical protein [Roseitranquillus sediminis]
MRTMQEHQAERPMHQVIAKLSGLQQGEVAADVAGVAAIVAMLVVGLHLPLLI